MDAHAFRCLCSSLQSLLLGARLEKIQRPTPDLHVFTVYAGGQKRFLMLRHGRQSPLLFFATHKLPAPQEPTAVVMRMRRYCAGRRVKAVRYDWLGRKIGLLMHHDPETWLVLDLRNGPFLASDFSAAATQIDENTIDIDVLRADFDALYAQAQEGATSLSEPAQWRQYPFMTPSLRKALVPLAMEDPAEAAALVMDVLADMEQCADLAKDAEARVDVQAEDASDDTTADNTCNLFVYCEQDGAQEIPVKLSAWLLPKALQLDEKTSQSYTEHHFTNVIEATTFFGQGVAFTGISDDAQRLAVKPLANEAARLKRLLAKFDSEEKRLQKMLALRDEAVALQGVLYQVPVDAKMSSIDVPASALAKEGEAVGDSDTISIKLNPLRTVRENMADMFHQSRRGARGLEILAQRRADVLAQEALTMDEVRDITAQKASHDGLADASVKQSHHDNVRLLQADQKQKQAIKQDQKQNQKCGQKQGINKVSQAQTAKHQPLATKYAKLVESFQSYDGIRLLRGRNSEGNGAVLKLAQGHDIWMHAADGPSAHLIIKRDHAEHDVPQTTLKEAAQLVAVKSWQRYDAQAEIMCAYAKDVKAIKGAAAGKVRVERTFMSLTVRLPQVTES